jgi:BirA family biotin operon repressor/biotin-[acetyl-CoA-carboxylase] ligase
MMTAADLLTIEAIRRGLRGEVVGRQIYLFGEVDSTNARLRRLVRAGARPGTVVLAESQSAGRGRLGQTWFSPPGVNLYASVLLQPTLRAEELPVFSLVASLALSDALRDLGLAPGIKWPNDVLLDGRKVAGSLLEAGVRNGIVEHVIVGIGVNLNVDAGTLRAALGAAGRFATSVSAVTGHEVDRNAFAAAYLTALDAWARRWETAGAAAVLTAWRARDIITGRRVEVRGAGRAFEGRALGVDDHGSLVVQDTRGAEHVVTSEEVRLAD